MHTHYDILISRDKSLLIQFWERVASKPDGSFFFLLLFDFIGPPYLHEWCLVFAPLITTYICKYCVGQKLSLTTFKYFCVSCYMELSVFLRSRLKSQGAKRSPRMKLVQEVLPDFLMVQVLEKSLRETGRLCEGLLKWVSVVRNVPLIEVTV